MMIKKRKKRRVYPYSRRKSSEKVVTPQQILLQTIQEAHQQTGLKNFPEAVRLYSLAIQMIQENKAITPSEDNSTIDINFNNIHSTSPTPTNVNHITVPSTTNNNSAVQPNNVNNGNLNLLNGANGANNYLNAQQNIINNNFTTERKLEGTEIESIDKVDHTPLYVLYGCRSQAFFGMQQFELALEDADKSIQFNSKNALGYARKGKALYSLKRYKEALKCYEDGLKFADQNHAGLRRLIEVITQEMQGTTITSSIGCSTNQEDDQEALEREVEDNYEADLRAERRAGEWEAMTCTGTELLRPRHAYASTLFSSQHAWYIFGGYADKGEYMGDFYCFYFPSRTWFKLPVEGDAPKAKHSATMVSVESKKMIYMFGGTSEAGYLEELHSFDLQSRTWKEVKPKEGQPWPAKRWSHASVFCPKRNKIYVFGGVSSALSMLNDLWAFDINTETWSVMELKSDVIPAPRHVHTLSLWNDNLYVYGGFGGRVNYHDLYRYSLDNCQWYLVSDQVVGRRGHATVVYDNFLYIFGGRGKNGNSSSMLKCSVMDGTVEEIETITRPMARHYISAALWGGSMWVFGGIGRTNYNDMFRFWLSSPSQPSKSSSTVGQDLAILVNNPQFCDVCFLLKDDERAYGHRAILYARCEHFRGMFNSGMKESQQLAPIDLSHIEYLPFVAMLKWIYTGKVDESIDGNTALQLLELADQFLLPELRRNCAHVIRRFITPENVRDLLVLAEVHNSPQLQLFCQQFIETICSSFGVKAEFKRSLLLKALQVNIDDMEQTLLKKATQTVLEEQVRKWIEEILSEKFTADKAIIELLGDGVILCRLINKIQPDKIKFINTNIKFGFHKLENINKFLKSCVDLGIQENQLFLPIDLYEGKDVKKVLTTLGELSKVAMKEMKDYKGPVILTGAGSSPVIQRKVVIKTSPATSPLVLPKKENAKKLQTPPPLRRSIHKIVSSNQFDKLLASAALRWIESVISFNLENMKDDNLISVDIEISSKYSIDQSTFYKETYSGIKLCKTLNKLCYPKVIIPNVHENIGHNNFKARENIEHYLCGCKLIGLTVNDCFSTNDLIEEKNLPLVISNIYSLASYIRKNNHAGDFHWYGPLLNQVTRGTQSSTSLSLIDRIKVDNKIMLDAEVQPSPRTIMRYSFDGKLDEIVHSGLSSNGFDPSFKEESMDPPAAALESKKIGEEEPAPSQTADSDSSSDSSEREDSSSEESESSSNTAESDSESASDEEQIVGKISKPLHQQEPKLNVTSHGGLTDSPPLIPSNDDDQLPKSVEPTSGSEEEEVSVPQQQAERAEDIKFSPDLLHLEREEGSIPDQSREMEGFTNDSTNDSSMDRIREGDIPPQSEVDSMIKESSQEVLVTQIDAEIGKQEEAVARKEEGSKDAEVESTAEGKALQLETRTSNEQQSESTVPISDVAEIRIRIAPEEIEEATLVSEEEEKGNALGALVQEGLREEEKLPGEEAVVETENEAQASELVETASHAATVGGALEGKLEASSSPEAEPQQYALVEVVVPTTDTPDTPDIPTESLEAEEAIKILPECTESPSIILSEIAIQPSVQESPSESSIESNTPESIAMAVESPMSKGAVKDEEEVLPIETAETSQAEVVTVHEAQAIELVNKEAEISAIDTIPSLTPQAENEPNKSSKEEAEWEEVDIGKSLPVPIEIKEEKAVDLPADEELKKECSEPAVDKLPVVEELSNLLKEEASSIASIPGKKENTSKEVVVEVLPESVIGGKSQPGAEIQRSPSIPITVTTPKPSPPPPKKQESSSSWGWFTAVSKAVFGDEIESSPPPQQLKSNSPTQQQSKSNSPSSQGNVGDVVKSLFDSFWGSSDEPVEQPSPPPAKVIRGQLRGFPANFERSLGQIRLQAFEMLSEEMTQRVSELREVDCSVIDNIMNPPVFHLTDKYPTPYLSDRAKHHGVELNEFKNKTNQIIIQLRTKFSNETTNSKQVIQHTNDSLHLVYDEAQKLLAEASSLCIELVMRIGESWIIENLLSESERGSCPPNLSKHEHLALYSRQMLASLEQEITEITDDFRNFLFKVGTAGKVRVVRNCKDADVGTFSLAVDAMTTATAAKLDQDEKTALNYLAMCRNLLKPILIYLYRST